MTFEELWESVFPKMSEQSQKDINDHPVLKTLFKTWYLIGFNVGREQESDVEPFWNGYEYIPHPQYPALILLDDTSHFISERKIQGIWNIETHIYPYPESHHIE